MKYNKYTHSSIYKIVDNTNGNIYVGSTIQQPLVRRLDNHRGHYKKYLEGKERKCMSYDILDNGDYNIYLIEDYPCENRDQLRMREQYWIERTTCINKHVAYRSEEYKKEYQKNNRAKNLEHRLKKDRDRYNDPIKKEIIKEQAKQNHYKNREKNVKRMNELRRYKHSWGGTINSLECNLLRINIDLFT